MIPALDRLPQGQRRLLRRAPAAPTAAPLLATLSARRDFGEGWIFERKLDGVRMLASRHQGEVRLDVLQSISVLGSVIIYGME